MSKTTNRETAPAGGAAEHGLARLLDTPLLAQIVPHLAPETLHQLIQYRGLDACGELVTCATPAQLTSLVDLDLWRHTQPGRDEQFDVERFGEWVEVLVDTGEAVAARTVAALDQDLVSAGLSRYVRVFDPGIFEPVAQSDDERIDLHEAMREGDAVGVGDAPATREWRTDRLTCEVGGYIVRARRADAWDSIVALLVALENAHVDYFHAVMAACRRLSDSRPEVDGLDDLLMAPEQQLHDLAIERERRRSQQGYATPADARAFLQLARQPRAAEAPLASNPMVAAYFRAAEDAGEERPAAAGASAPGDSDVRASIDAVIELLAEARLMPEPPRALLGGAIEDPRSAKLPVLRRLMEFLLHHDETAYLTRSRELAFLANTLLAGASVQSRPFTPREASDAAASICNLGLECWPGAAPPSDAFLVHHHLVTAFEAGWSVLYRDVSLFVADQLISMLGELPCSADTRAGLRAFRRELEKQRAAGTPWLARGAADVLSTLDITAWISVVGLLDECPILPAALTAILERRTTPVSPTAFEFISTTAQIEQVRVFLRTLPELCA